MAIIASSSPPIKGHDFLPSSPQGHGTTEKTKTWAGLFFAVALVLAAAAAYYVYRAWGDRKPSLLIPALLWALVAMIIGTIGEILDKKPKAEAPAEVKNAPLHANLAYLEGEPVPIQNVGNTCFINALTQGIMNDRQYPHIFKRICERGKERHETFAAFLDLFLPSSFFSLNFFRSFFSLNFFRTGDAAPPLEVSNARDVLVMLSQKKSSLGYGTPEFETNYPRLFVLLGKKEEVFPVVADKELNAEFAKMKKDQRIMAFFSEERVNVEKTLLGFDAYLALIHSYEAARGVPHTVSLDRSPIGNVRNLMRGASSNSQEDVEEFFHCLTQYVRADDLQAFVSISHSQEWVECEAKYQDTKRINESFERHKRSKSPDDQLTALPADSITKSPVQPYCIFTIKDVLSENADGQTLLNQSLKVRDTLSDQQKSAAVYLKDGVPKMYYPIREKWIIERAPERFILQLKRFEWTDKGQRGKVDCNVNMPEVIDMDDKQYELQSVVVHTGTAEGGHYHAMVKKTTSGLTKWWYASDSQIESGSIDNVETALKKGYLYFYTATTPKV